MATSEWKEPNMRRCLGSPQNIDFQSVTLMKHGEGACVATILTMSSTDVLVITWQCGNAAHFALTVKGREEETYWRLLGWFPDPEAWRPTGAAGRRRWWQTGPVDRWPGPDRPGRWASVSGRPSCARTPFSSWAAPSYGSSGRPAKWRFSSPPPVLHSVKAKRPFIALKFKM